MPKHTLVLTFPPAVVKEPLTTHLVRDHGLSVNISRASISPDEVGHMVLELEGTRDAIESGRRYLEGCGVRCESLAKDVRRSEDRCTQCTACITVCPSGALSVDRESMEVSFDEEKCIGCELCTRVCPYRAMEIHV